MNVYLHEVLDKWFAEVVTARCGGKVVLIRYADDFIIGCQRGEDAQRTMHVLPNRFAKYGLEVNLEKSKLVRFVRPGRPSMTGTSSPKSGTFGFPGFTCYWGRTWKGGYTIKRKTEGKRPRRTRIAYW